MRQEKFIEIHGDKYFKPDIEQMDIKTIHQICAFLDENELRWVQTHCIEDAKYIIDNILFKL